MMPAIYNVADMFIVTMMICVALLVLLGVRLDGTREPRAVKETPAADTAATDSTPTDSTPTDTTSTGSAPAEAPIDGYDSFSIAQLRGRLRGYALSTVADLVAYEEANQAREPYLRMLRNRLEKLEEQAVESSPLAPRGA